MFLDKASFHPNLFKTLCVTFMEAIFHFCLIEIKSVAGSLINFKFFGPNPKKFQWAEVLGSLMGLPLLVPQERHWFATKTTSFSNNGKMPDLYKTPRLSRTSNPLPGICIKSALTYVSSSITMQPEFFVSI